MIDMDDFFRKESRQSHSFAFFKSGPPYVGLGWERYKIFNEAILTTIFDFVNDNSINLFVHEQECISIDRMFLWCFSFFEDNSARRDSLTESLVNKIRSVISEFYSIDELCIINNHDSDFSIHPDLGEYYLHIVELGDAELAPARYDSRQKLYKKDDIDLKKLSGGLSVAEFRDIIERQTSIGSMDGVEYITAIDGFLSNTHRPNKYLREEFIPALHFINNRKLPGSANIRFGMKGDDFDAKIDDPENDVNLTLEMTLACPNNDHQLFGIVSQTGAGFLPVKTLAHLKKERDSLPGKVVEAIVKKYEKNYIGDRTLIVIIQPEYVYHGEDYIIRELINEVRASVSARDNAIKEVLLLCGSKFYDLF